MIALVAELDVVEIVEVAEVAPVVKPSITTQTRTVKCSQCGQEFPFGTAEQAATKGQGGFSHCGDHRKAFAENRNYVAFTLSHEEFAALGLTVPLAFMRKLSDGVAISVPFNCYAIVKEIVAEMREVQALQPQPVNGAQAGYGIGRYSGD